MKDPLLNPLFRSNSPDHSQDDGLEFKLIDMLRRGPTQPEAFLPLPPFCTNGLAGKTLWINRIPTNDANIATCEIGATQQNQVQVFDI